MGLQRVGHDWVTEQTKSNLVWEVWWDDQLGKAFPRPEVGMICSRWGEAPWTAQGRVQGRGNIIQWQQKAECRGQVWSQHWVVLFDFLVPGQCFSSRKLCLFQYGQRMGSSGWIWPRLLFYINFCWSIVTVQYCVSFSCMQSKSAVYIHAQSLSRVQLFVTPWTVGLLCPWDFSGKNTGVSSLFLCIYI